MNKMIIIRCTRTFTLLIFTLLTHSLFSQDLQVVQFNSGPVQFEPNLNEGDRGKIQLQGSAFNGEHYVWAQFKAIPDELDRNALKSGGIRFIEYIPNNCYLLAIPSESQRADLYRHGVRAVYPLRPKDKLDHRVSMGLIPEYANDSEGISLKVMSMPGVNVREQVSEIVNLGAANIEYVHHDRFVLISADQEEARAISLLPWVRYVELMDPPGEPESVEGRGIQRGNVIDNHLTSGGLSYNADGIKVLVRDDGNVGPHIDFQGRLWNDPNNTSGGTHGDGVAGVWAACGNLDPAITTSASAADVYVIDYLSTFLDNTLTLHQDSGVVITNSSYSNGCNVGYTSTTLTVDEMVYDNPTLLHVFSAGNSNGSDCGYGAGSQWGNVTGGHKMGKNVLTVANLWRDGSLVSSSSRGPAHDGRIKPDIAGHGQGQISTDPNNQYQSFGGTSAAAPSTAGNIAQLYHVYKDLNGVTPPSALIKACALNTCTDLGNVGPDFKFGWGLVNAGRAYEVLANNQYFDATISHNGSNSHQITVPAGVGELRVMVYWADPEASINASPALVNDLDLVVEDPSSTVYLPYLLDHTPDPLLLDLPAGNGADHLNNMEQVSITNPVAGTYDIDISGFSIPQGPQEYFIVYAFIPAGVKVTYPLGGEKIERGSLERIHWDAFGNTGTFQVDYSTNNGSSWSTIAAGIAADERGVDWNVPSGIVSGNCLIRVQRGGEVDQSDETFSIHGVPQNLTTSMPGTSSVQLSWNGIAGVTEYDVYQLGSEKMEIIGTTNGTTFNVGGLTNGIEYWFAVAANTPPAMGQRTLAVSYIHDVTSVCSGCLADLTLPYEEDFEEGLGSYCNVEFVDDIDWIRIQGGTPSVGTGPASASSGSYYLYVEATDPNFPAMSAELGGPCLDLSGYSNAYMEFYYHMYGISMGSLELEVSTNQGTTWSSPIWSVSGDQGDEWHLAQLDLTAYCGGDLTFRFNGTTGTGFESDICIDQILIDEGELCLTPANLSVSNIMETSVDVSWSAASGANTYSIELVDVSAGGQFTGIPTHTGIAGTATLLTGLTSFNDYEVYLRSECSGDDSPWVGPVTFLTDGCLVVDNWMDDFDSYALCGTGGGNVVCAIGGGWTQDQSDGNDWRVNTGGTPSSFTGPLADHTTGSDGNYLYIEASSVFNLTSNLISNCIDLDSIGSGTLSFYYHMYGVSMGTLNVDISTNGGSSWTNLWSQSGQVQTDHSDPWELAEVSLSGYTGVVLIRFQGIAGPNYESDICIDDILIEGSEDCNTAGLITGTPLSGEYRSSGPLTSDATIVQPRSVLFSSPQEIDLLSNFEVELGAEFEANNDDCNN